MRTTGFILCLAAVAASPVVKGLMLETSSSPSVKSLGTFVPGAVITISIYPDSQDCTGRLQNVEVDSDMQCLPGATVPSFQSTCQDSGHFSQNDFTGPNCTGTKTTGPVSKTGCHPLKAGGSGYFICSNIGKPKCPKACKGTPPACHCAITPNPKFPTGTQITTPVGKDISVTTFFGDASANRPKPDCSAVSGCGKNDCNECISQYWSSTPNECTPGCEKGKSAKPSAKKLRSMIAGPLIKAKAMRLPAPNANFTKSDAVITISVYTSTDCSGPISSTNAYANDECGEAVGGGSLENSCKDVDSFTQKSWDTSTSCGGNPDHVIDAKTGCNQFKTGGSGYFTCSDIGKPKCPPACMGTAPNCHCPVKPNPNSPSGTATTTPVGTDITVTSFFGNASANGPKPDCSAVSGCGKRDCNECISQYWSSTPNECTPGCE